MMLTRLKLLVPGLTTLHFDQGSTVHLLTVHPVTLLVAVVAAALVGRIL